MESYQTNPNFSALFKSFADALIGTTHHIVMINQYSNPMATILSVIDSNRMGDIENYKAISYTGLKDTDLWKKTIAGTVDEALIDQLITATYNGLESCK